MEAVLIFKMADIVKLYCFCIYRNIQIYNYMSVNEIPGLRNIVKLTKIYFVYRPISTFGITDKEVRPTPF